MSNNVVFFIDISQRSCIAGFYYKCILLRWQYLELNLFLCNFALIRISGRQTGTKI